MLNTQYILTIIATFIVLLTLLKPILNIEEAGLYEEEGNPYKGKSSWERSLISDPQSCNIQLPHSVPLWSWLRTIRLLLFVFSLLYDPSFIFSNE